MLGAVFMVNWFIHIHMTVSYSDQYGWSGYSRFKQKFSEYEWRCENGYRYSLFANGYTNEVHASIIKFDNKGMVMIDPVSFLLTQLYVRKYIKNNYKKNVVKW